MSRKLFAFLLSELNIVRVICPRPECGAVTEVTVRQLGLRFDRTPSCPVCNKDLCTPDRSGKPNALERLADAIRDLQGESQRVQVEFILPDKSE